MRTLTSATDYQDDPIIEEFLFDAPKMALAVACNIAWDEMVGLAEVHLVDEKQEGIGEASEALHDELPEVSARNGLP